MPYTRLFPLRYNTHVCKQYLKRQTCHSSAPATHSPVPMMATQQNAIKPKPQIRLIRLRASYFEVWYFSPWRLKNSAIPRKNTLVATINKYISSDICMEHLLLLFSPAKKTWLPLFEWPHTNLSPHNAAYPSFAALFAWNACPNTYTSNPLLNAACQFQNPYLLAYPLARHWNMPECQSLIPNILEQACLWIASGLGCGSIELPAHDLSALTCTHNHQTSKEVYLLMPWHLSYW